MKKSENMTLQGTVQQREDSSRNQQQQSRLLALPGRWSLLVGLILAPWAFGSVYHDAQFWMSVVLLIGLAFWWLETALNRHSRQVVPYIGFLVMGGILIGALQLCSLPEGLADMLLGRQTEIYDSFLGGADVQHRITLNRAGTWNQLRLLAIALSALLLGCRYFRSSRDIALLLGVGTANGVLLSFVGMIQKLTFSGKILWFYEISRGAPFGPFINRNNAAGFLLMGLACCIGLLPIVMASAKNEGPRPMVSKEMPFWRQYYFHLIYFMSELTATKLTVLFSSVFISAGIVASMSRGGVVALLIASIATIMLYGMARRPANSGLVLLPMVGLAVLLTCWIGFGQQLIDRFSHVDLVDVSNADARIQHWQDVLPITSEMGWLGAGLGTYQGIHRLYSTSPEKVLFEYAENQYLQSIVEAGWPGLILLLLALILAIHYALKLLNRGQSATSIGVGTFGVFLLFSQGAASLFDFGLYVPANVFQMSVLVGFLAYHAHALSGRMKKKGWLRFEFSNLFVQVLTLFLIAGITVAALDLNRRSRLDSMMDISKFDYQSMNLQETDRRLTEMKTLALRCTYVKAYNYLGELWIHRARLQFLESLQQDPAFQNALAVREPEEQELMRQYIWGITSLQRLQENAYYLRTENSPREARQFLKRAFIQENLPQATKYLDISRTVSPLQPVVHIRLGQIMGLIGGRESGDRDMERAVALAPNNVSYRKLAGTYYLQNDNIESAAVHLRKYLELSPISFKSLMKLLRGKTSRRMGGVSNSQILESIIPDDPKMLYDFSKQWLQDDPEIQLATLERAERILGDVLPTRIEDLLLLANICLDKGDTDRAIDSMLTALTSNPLKEDLRYRVTQLLYKQERLEEALDSGNELLRLNYRNLAYNELVDKIRDELQDSDIKAKQEQKQ